MLHLIVTLTVFILLMSTNNSNVLASNDLAIALDRINKIVHFFERNSDRINADALFGIRIAQGVFNRVANIEDTTNYKLKLSVNLLNKRLSCLATKVTKLVEIQTPEYYNQFKLIINGPYIIGNQRISLQDYKFKYNYYYNNKTFNEKFSDSCLDLLMNNNNCDTDSKCFDYFLQENASEYFLTHQLLYFIIADHIGCSKKVLHELVSHLDKRNVYIFGENVNDFDMSIVVTYYSGKIYGEAFKLYDEIRSGDKSFKQDLFIEQNVLLGMLGIKEFYNKKFLQLIGSFQLSTGCFGGEITEFNGINVEADFEKVLNEIYFSFGSDLVKSKRFKRFDIKMANGCSAHQTGLAIAYFSLYFNQVLDNLE